MKTVVFSDMDGTLLNEHYSFEFTKPALDQLLAMGASIVLCSSKTRAEIQLFRKKFGIKDPFISENGAAIFIPRNYFKNTPNYDLTIGEFGVVEIGLPYLILREKLESIRRKTGFNLVGFGDLTAEEVASDSGLPVELAALAKKREYDEPFRMLSGDESKLMAAADVEGVCITRGDRYWHLKGNHDKGFAVKTLTNLYAKNFGHMRTIAVGNGPNDLPMLSVVNKPFFVGATDRLDDVWNKVVAWVFGQN